MRRVVEHGQFYQEKKKIAGIPYVECPECGFKIDIDLDYYDKGMNLVKCECGCLFSFDVEDIMYRQFKGY